MHSGWDLDIACLSLHGRPNFELTFTLQSFADACSMSLENRSILFCLLSSDYNLYLGRKDVYLVHLIR